MKQERIQLLEIALKLATVSECRSKGKVIDIAKELEQYVVGVPEAKAKVTPKKRSKVKR